MGKRGKPVIIGGDPEKRHGIVLTASYEAKAKGVKTGMTVFEAAKLCPEATFIKPQHHLYVHFSTRILRIMRDFTPMVEPFSIDEAFLDVTGCEKLFGSPVEIAYKLKKRIRKEVGITCSIGVAPNKLLAKMATGLQKPDGLTVIDYKDVPTHIWPLPVKELFGVGPRYENHLKLFNIHTIGDLAAEIYRTAGDLLQKHWPEGWPVRTVGVALAGLTHPLVEQLTLFGEKEKISRIEETCDQIRSRFGPKAIFRAVSLTRAGVRYA